MPACPNCSQENPEGFRLCGMCGAQLTAERDTGREERKVVTVLFADLVGFTSRAEKLDPEEVRALQAPYWARVRSELERHGGTVEKFIGDAVMALFGAPQAHEDDPERAVRAALAIRDALTEDEGELQVRIGITTGEALISLGARPAEGEGMASGGVVNTAARLQSGAPEQGILVDETTFRATERAIAYREAEPVEAKGKAEPVRAWEALEARSRFGVDVGHAPRAPLVGRDDELDVLLSALARMRRERSPQFLTLIGAPGIGKSRLVNEVFRALEREPELITWRQGRSLPYGEGVTYSALAEMVKGEAGILETDAADEADAKLESAVDAVVLDEADRARIAEYLRPLVGLAEEGTLGRDRQADAFAAWRHFLEAMAEQRPLVLVFEDLHWADDGFLDFIDHLADWVTDLPLLTIATARPELLERRPAWGGGRLNSTTLAVTPLSAVETAKLLAALLEQAVLPAETQAALLDRAGGNPLYAEEYVRMLVDRGFLRRDGRAWRLERSGELPLPESVQGVVAARLDVLAAEEKALLQDASVLGKVFWLGPLATMGRRPSEAVEDALRALVRREFVRAERRSSVAGEREYAFRHLLVRDVAYGQIPRAVRAEKHRSAAEWIEALSPDRTEDRAEMLAHHYLSALDLGQTSTELEERARVALREAGDRAFALNAFPAASRFYRRAIDLWPQADPERAYVLLRCGEARLLAEEAGAEELEEALEALVRLGDREAAAIAEVRLGEYRRDDRKIKVHFERAFSLVDGLPPSRAKALVLSRVAGRAAAVGESDWEERAEQALAMTEELGLEELRADVLSTIGAARSLSGDERAIAALEEAVAITLRLNVAEAIRAYINLAAALQDRGELRRCFEVHAEGRRLSERIGSWHDIRHLQTELVLECYWRGRWDAGSAQADEFLTAVEAGSPYPIGEVAARTARANMRLARGDLENALADAHKAVDAGRQMSYWGILEWALATSARVLTAAGREREAASAASEALDAWTDPRRSNPPYAIPDLAVAFVQLERGQDLADVVEPLAESSRWLRAAVAYGRGDFSSAADVFAEIGSLPDEAYAHLRAAEQLVSEGRRAEADVQLQRALAFYRSVGATSYQREGEALLAASA